MQHRLVRRLGGVLVRGPLRCPGRGRFSIVLGIAFLLGAVVMLCGCRGARILILLGVCAVLGRLWLVIPLLSSALPTFELLLPPLEWPRVLLLANHLAVRLVGVVGFGLRLGAGRLFFVGLGCRLVW